jgi:hypothetical protein
MGSSRRIVRVLSRSALLAAVILAVSVLVAPRLIPVHAVSSARADDMNYQHVFIIMMENTGIEAPVGNPNAPWINQAIQTNGVAGNYYGVSHPSQPNYIVATSGALNGVLNDNDISIDVPNIVDQLEAHGKTWKGYM